MIKVNLIGRKKIAYWKSLWDVLCNDPLALAVIGFLMGVLIGVLI